MSVHVKIPRPQARSESPAPSSPVPAPPVAVEDKADGRAEVERADRFGHHLDKLEVSDRGGLPGRLRTGLEKLSGVDLGGVRVHYGSPKPAQLQALAYAQGNDIHLAPGQEQHLPHEAWHVVQQKRGRVRPTLRLGSVEINDDPALEKEASDMGDRAAAMKAEAVALVSDHGPEPQAGVVQGKFKIIGGNTYEEEKDVKISSLKKYNLNVRKGVSKAEVIARIKAWAKAGEDKGEYSWKDLIAAVAAELAAEKAPAAQESSESEEEEETEEEDTPPSVLSALPLSSSIPSALPTPYPSSPVQSSEFSLDLLGSYTPSKAPGTPPGHDVLERDRRRSDMFLEIGKQKGFSRDVRSRTTTLTHRDTGSKAKTVTAGRFMVGLKGLGKTRYQEFLPQLPEWTGLTEVEVAQAVIDGLLDDEKFQKTLETLPKPEGKDALLSTIKLMHNEILHRSSTNLLSIIGAAKRTVEDPSKGLSDRLTTEARFIPSIKDDKRKKVKKKIGGQAFSRMHQPDKEISEEDLRSELQEVWRKYRKSEAAVTQESFGGNVEAMMESLSEGLAKKYWENFGEHWTLDSGSSSTTSNVASSSTSIQSNE